jgi:N-methylhydantoinase A/oxoprolinase/acetone carboxylase beta subunit
MSTLLVADIGGTTVKIGFVVEGVPQTYERVFPTSHLAARTQ